jgi:uncharacterized repeat protein (TIGR04138 family)
MHSKDSGRQGRQSGVVESGGSHYIRPREPLDQTGTVGAVHHLWLAVDRLGGEDVSHGAPASGSKRRAPGLKMHEVTFEEALEQIAAKDPRYHRDAYLFVREALDHTQKLIVKENRGRLRHVSGQELLDGIRDYALGQFGPMAMTVLNEWAVHRCEDFGEIVFNMVDIGLLAKTEHDDRADFAGGYDFETAFRKPFVPASKKKARGRLGEPAPDQVN